MSEQAVVPSERVRVVRRAERESIWFMGDLIQPIITSEMTDGRLMIALTHAKPSSEPPLHEHDAEDEIFFILEGEMSFWAGETEAVLGAGDCILMPRDVPHTFCTAADQEVKWLVFTAPGGLEKFFRAVAVPAEYPAPQQGWRMDDETEARLRVAAREYGITIIAPPGTRPAQVMSY